MAHAAKLKLSKAHQLQMKELELHSTIYMYIIYICQWQKLYLPYLIKCCVRLIIVSMRSHHWLTRYVYNELYFASKTAFYIYSNLLNKRTFLTRPWTNNRLSVRSVMAQISKANKLLRILQRKVIYTVTSELVITLHNLSRIIVGACACKYVHSP